MTGTDPKTMKEPRRKPITCGIDIYHDLPETLDVTVFALGAGASRVRRRRTRARAVLVLTCHGAHAKPAHRAASNKRLTTQAIRTNGSHDARERKVLRKTSAISECLGPSPVAPSMELWPIIAELCASATWWSLLI